MATSKRPSGGGEGWLTLLSLIANLSQAAKADSLTAAHRQLAIRAGSLLGVVKELQARAEQLAEARLRLEEEVKRLEGELKRVRATDAEREERFNRQSYVIAQLQAEVETLKAKGRWKRQGPAQG